MNNIHIKDVPLSETERKNSGIRYSTLSIELSYSLGGYGGFDWTKRPRGYRLFISPCDVNEYGNGLISRTSTLLGNSKESSSFITIETTKRFNRKRMTQLASVVDPDHVKHLWLTDHNGLIDYVTSLPSLIK